MKAFAKIAALIEKGVTLMKFFECVNAALVAFVEKAKTNGLYKAEETKDEKVS